MEGIFERISSLAAALSILLGGAGKKADPAATPAEEAGWQGGHDEIPPMLLMAPLPEKMSDYQFARHRSHSSHRSHQSGSSGGRSRKYAPVPVYIPSTPTPTPRPTPSPGSTISRPLSIPHPTATERTHGTPSGTSSSTTSVQSQSARTPVPKPVQTPLVKLEFKNGAIFYGQIVVKAPNGVTIRMADGKTHKIPKSLLTPATVEQLDLSK